MFCFHAYGQVSQKKKKKFQIVFSNNKISKKRKGFSMHFGFNNQFIKVTRTDQYFKNSKKIILFSFNI